MRPHWFHIVAILATCCAVTLAASATKTAAKPSTKAAMESARAALQGAIDALSGEYRASLSNPDEHRLRSACDYFTAAGAEKLNLETVLDALAAPVGGDGREAAYVKWQLLSALPEWPDEKVAAALLQAYRAAPLPIPRPGISPADQQKLDRLVQGKKLADEADVKRQVELIFKAASEQNQPILVYRDELYHRLPKTFDAFAVALDDLQQRLTAVAEGKALARELAGDMKEWAAGGNPPRQQLSSLASAVQRLADSRGPQYYGSPYWRDSGSTFVWRKTRSGVESGRGLKDLAEFLDEQSKIKPSKEPHAR